MTESCLTRLDRPYLFECDNFDIISFDYDGPRYHVWKTMRIPSEEKRFEAVLIPIDQREEDRPSSEETPDTGRFFDSYVYKTTDGLGPRVYRHRRGHDGGSTLAQAHMTVAFQHLHRAKETEPEKIDEEDLNITLDEWLSLGEYNPEAFWEIYEFFVEFSDVVREGAEERSAGAQVIAEQRD